MESKKKSGKQKGGGEGNGNIINQRPLKSLSRFPHDTI